MMPKVVPPDDPRRVCRGCKHDPQRKGSVGAKRAAFRAPFAAGLFVCVTKV